VAATPTEEVATVTPASLTHKWAEPKPNAGGCFWGTGRRKSAVARVRIKAGTGQFKINGKEIDEYLKVERDRRVVVAPLEATDTRKRFDVFVNATGGGTTGQAGAIVLGVARALLKASGEYQPLLRDGKFLTRDARKVERKKYGQRGARRSFQFSKR
jgi:small subunit ribosomal protein S9